MNKTFIEKMEIFCIAGACLLLSTAAVGLVALLAIKLFKEIN